MSFSVFASLVRLTAPDSREDRKALGLIRASATWQLLLRTRNVAQAAAEGSWLFGRSRGVFDRWTATHVARRSRSIGLILLVASATHVVLNSQLTVTPGWLWLLVPGTTAAVGALLLGISLLPRLRRGGRLDRDNT